MTTGRLSVHVYSVMPYSLQVSTDLGLRPRATPVLFRSVAAAVFATSVYVGKKHELVRIRKALEVAGRDLCLRDRDGGVPTFGHMDSMTSRAVELERDEC